MNVQFRDRPESSTSASIKTAIADCDIHPARATNDELYPFMAKRWHGHLETYGKQAYHGMMEGPPYPKAQPNASRRDAWPPEGGPAGLLAVLHAEAVARSHITSRSACSIRSTAGRACATRIWPRAICYRDQRLADREMDQQGQAPEGLDRRRQ